MFMRMVHARVKEGQLSALRDRYEDTVIPSLQRTTGCLYAGLINNPRSPDETISMTLWRSKDDADAYEEGGTYESLLTSIRPYLDDSSEYHIRLSEDLTLEYVPLDSDVRVERYDVEETEGLSPDIHSRSLCVRIVSMKVPEEKQEQFREIYRGSVVPALREVQGCHHVFLTANEARENEILSVTVWSSEREARAYEQSGLFRWLLEALRPALSDLSQMKLESGQRTGTVATSDDIVVQIYSVLTSRGFEADGT